MTLRRAKPFWAKKKAGGGGLPYTPPLDVFSNASAAYSVRKLRSAYTGACMRIANSGDSQTDIGFDVNGLVDISAIIAHVGVNQPAYVVKWYDQSGNGNDATGASTNSSRKQISFISSGIFYVNLIPAIYGDNSGSGAASKSLLLSTRIQIGSFLCVGKIQSNLVVNYIGWDSTTSDGIFTGGSNSSATGFGIVKSGAFTALVNSAENFNQRLWEYFGGSTDYVYTDGSNEDSATITNPWIREIGRTTANSGGANLSMDGPLQEIIIFSDDKISDRASIESNINSYFSIY